MRDITGLMACIAVLFLALTVYLQMRRIDKLEASLLATLTAQLDYQKAATQLLKALDKRIDLIIED